MAKKNEWPNWNEKDMELSFQGLVEKKRKALTTIKKVDKGKRNFNNTIQALEESKYALTDALNRVDFLMYVSPDKKIRDKAQELDIRLRKELLPFEFDRDIWQAIKDYKKINEKIPPEKSKLLEDYYRSYRKRGFDLEDGKFKRLQEIINQLSDLSSQFSKNINEYEDHILLSQDDAKDLPSTYLNTLSKKGKRYVVTLSYPDYFTFMEYSGNEKLREMLTLKFNKKGGEGNKKLMEQILSLRFEMAKLLGYQNPAELEIEDKMAKKPKTVLNFLYRVEKEVISIARGNMKELENEKRRYLNNPKAKLLYHDIAFYARLLRERTLEIDKEEIKKHFQFDKVRQTVFDIYSELLGVSFVKLKNNAWHQDVERFVIKDGDGGEIATFYMDMFPRQGKYGHAAAFTIIEGRKEGGKYVKPVSALVMNVPKPQINQPSLLSHGEVTTFFHEFGHIMHQTLTKASFMSHSGTNVSMDFVEAPSQIFENWAWDKDIIKKFAFHYINQKPMDELLVNKLIQSKKFLKGFATARQLIFANFDMSIHVNRPQSIDQVISEWQKKLIGIEFPKGSVPSASFGHFIGYGAGYYGYLWSEVYALDMFSVFEKEGILNKRTGIRYRKEILERGSSREEMESVRAFLKRSSSSKPFSNSLK
jgi:thimet oligopeptidase